MFADLLQPEEIMLPQLIAPFLKTNLFENQIHHGMDSNSPAKQLFTWQKNRNILLKKM